MAGRFGRTVSVGLAVTAASAFGVSGVAVAHKDNGKHKYQAKIKAVPHSSEADNGSNAHAKAWIKRHGNQVKVRVHAFGVTANLPHAMHIHGKDAGELAQCPGARHRDDLVDDGLIETVEGLDDYGPIQVSLTTSGDTTPESALALDRFPVAHAQEHFFYVRKFTIPSEIARNLHEKHIVIHGEDLNNDGQYGGRTTALGAPLEAELPVACGEIKRHH